MPPTLEGVARCLAQSATVFNHGKCCLFIVGIVLTVQTFNHRKLHFIILGNLILSNRIGIQFPFLVGHACSNFSE